MNNLENTIACLLFIIIVILMILLLNTPTAETKLFNQCVDKIQDVEKCSKAVTNLFNGGKEYNK